MTKVLKIISRILGIISEWVLALVIICLFLLTTKYVQTKIAQKATNYLSKELHTTIRIEGLSISFFDELALNNILILDQSRDTLLHTDIAFIQLDHFTFDQDRIELKKIEFDSGKVSISRDKNTGDYNYWFITDYLEGGSSSSSSSPPTISVQNILFKDMRVSYHDYRKGYSTAGMDYDHIETSNVSFTITHFSNSHGVSQGKITGFTAKERSGFYVKNMDTRFSVCNEWIKLSQLHIQTPYSDLSAPKLHFLMRDVNNLQTFEDSVDIDAILLESKINLRDIAHFAPELTGMNQPVFLSGTFTQKIKNLKINDFSIKLGKNTSLFGNIQLPDFRYFENAVLHQTIKKATISISDLKAIRLPNSEKKKHLSFDEHIERLAYFKASNLRVDGFHDQFVIAADSLKTKIGKIQFKNGIMFSKDHAKNLYTFRQSSGSVEKDLRVVNFELNKLLSDEQFGIVDAHVSVSGRIYSWEKIDFDSIAGKINTFDFKGYSYSNLDVEYGSFVDNKLIASIEIQDDNLNLTYDGFIDFKNNQHMNFSVDLHKALLHNLHITKSDSTILKSKFTVDLYGSSFNSVSGDIYLEGLQYQEGTRFVRVPKLTLSMQRRPEEDIFQVASNVASAQVAGKIDADHLVGDFLNQFNKVFPSIVDVASNKTSKYTKRSPSNFTYNVVAGDMSEFLSIFMPDILIEKNTRLSGAFDGSKEEFTLNLSSKGISYQSILFSGIDIRQQLTNQDIQASYSIQKLNYSDSITLDNVQFKTYGKHNQLQSSLTWNPNSKNESLISWETNIHSVSELNFVLNPSHFSINEQRWDIANESEMTIAAFDTHISKFKLERGDQFISVDGCLSKNDADKLNFKINDLDLQELSKLLGSDVALKGKMNSWGYISNPYTNLTYLGDASIVDLYANEREVGDVYLQSGWNRESQSIKMEGDLIYRGNETFRFDGGYHLDRTHDNLDFDLVFDKTDIQFTNAFLDEDVITNVKGVIDGTLRLDGTIDDPKINGQVNLLGGNAKVSILGVNFGLDGKIKVDPDGFYIDNMPVTDEEGNIGSMIASVYHTNFSNWNYDLQFDLETRIANGPQFIWNAPNVGLDKFLILNTQYVDGDYYYGKGYATGTANISGDLENTYITVDVNTRKGTNIYFPMYGSGELEEDDPMITFISKNQDLSQYIPKIDFTGIDLDMNFHVTPDAKLKLIFNEETGDEISAIGSGDISMSLNKLNELTMDGTYKVKQGTYDFAMGPVKQPFVIEEGGTISWSGDPYNATLDIKTYYEVNADINELSGDELQGGSKTLVQKIRCYLNLNESMLLPTISFDIAAPKADETGKALISRITSDRDELNRQFFSLMLWKKFQPLRGSTIAGESAALDLASNQINSMLSQVSSKYKLNVNLDSDDNTGKKSYAVGVTKGFLDDRLVFTGNFGVENMTTSSTAQPNALIGDMSLEYSLNETGTFRVNIFNQSNQSNSANSASTYTNVYGFTQGIGVHYQEDFDAVSGFKLIQYGMDVFRKKGKKKYPIKRKKRQKPIPSQLPNEVILKKEEEIVP